MKLLRDASSLGEPLLKSEIDPAGYLAQADSIERHYATGARRGGTQLEPPGLPPKGINLKREPRIIGVPNSICACRHHSKAIAPMFQVGVVAIPSSHRFAPGMIVPFEQVPVANPIRPGETQADIGEGDSLMAAGNMNSSQDADAL